MKNKSKRFKVSVSVIAVCVALLAGACAFQFIYIHKNNDKPLITSIFNTENKTVAEKDESSETATDESTSAINTTESTTAESTTGVETTSLLNTDPLKFSKADLIKYVNKAGNRVRQEKPGFTYVEKTTISNFKLGDSSEGLMKIAEKIISFFFEDYNIPVAKGSKSAPLEDYALTSYFGSEQGDWAINFKDEDIKSAKISEENGMYRIDLKLIEEINPEKNGQSAYSRGILIMSVDDVMKIANENNDGLFSMKMAVNAKKENIKLNYNDGYVSVLIDKQGRIKEMSSGMKIDASGKDISVRVGSEKVRLLSFDVDSVSVRIGKDYKQIDFVW